MSRQFWQGLFPSQRDAIPRDEHFEHGIFLPGQSDIPALPVGPSRSKIAGLAERLSAEDEPEAADGPGPIRLRRGLAAVRPVRTLVAAAAFLLSGLLPAIIARASGVKLQVGIEIAPGARFWPLLR